MDYSIEAYKKLLIETFKVFVDFCKEHNIKYVGAYGTVLGAVRHKGLIPWDDDIDVYMDRENYEKFLSFRNDKSLNDYEIIDVEKEYYYLPYAKFSNKHTTIWEIRKLECVIGVFIDVFPLDEVDDLEVSKSIHDNYCSLYDRYVHSLISLFSPDVFFHPSYFMKVLHSKIKKRQIVKEIKQLEDEIKSISGDKLMYYRSRDRYERCVIPKSWIEETIEIPYEDTLICVPKDYESYLKFNYGDYMTLPPMKDRVSDHHHYYIDLSKRLSIKEIKERIK